MIQASVGRDHYLYRLSMTNLAALHLRVGEPKEAERIVREILPDLEGRHRQFGGVETFYLASALEVLGGAQVMQGRLAEAAGSYRGALQSLAAATKDETAGLRERIDEKLAEIEDELDSS
jgi:serine/threonine-protein kinase